MKGEVRYFVGRVEPRRAEAQRTKLLQDYREGCLPEYVGPPEARGANRDRFFMLRPLYGLLGLVLKPRPGYTTAGGRALKRITARSSV